LHDEQTWILRRRAPSPLPPQYESLDPLLAKVLYARKLERPEDLEAFLGATTATPPNPFAMRGMRVAVGRLVWGVLHGEPIVVYGDYDTDGVTATALLASALRVLGANVAPYIPDRFGESYGLNTVALDELHNRGIRLVVTVDCGIRATREAAHAAELGLDLIITDHHSVPSELPRALAVIDPKQPGCEYPFKELAGVGVAYRLVEALFTVWNSIRPPGEPLADAEQFLDLVALGTVGDIVPLVGENRTLVQKGLVMLRGPIRPGISALMGAAGVRPERLSSDDIAFRLGPRLNAAGRLEHADLAYRLLVSQAPDESRGLAEELSQINERRQALLDAQVTQALETIGDVGDRSLLFVSGEDYHEGIVGLIASRIVDLHYLPTVVIRSSEGSARGSARSIEGYHITRALETCSDLLERFGGHARAAGFSMRAEHVDALRTRLEEHAKHELDGSPYLQRRLDVDAIVRLDELTLESVRALDDLEPCGEGNPPPTLATVGLQVADVRPVGSDGQHLRLYLSGGGGSMAAIAFRQGHLGESLRVGDYVDVVYTPTLNEYNGTVSVQMVVQALRASQAAARG